MKKMIAMLVLVGAFTAAHANYNAKTNAFVQPFSQSYALAYDGPYLWFTDAEYTNPVGSYYDIFYEIDRLHLCFGGYSFSHVWYSGLNEFEYGITLDGQYTAVIWSDLTW